MKTRLCGVLLLCAFCASGLVAETIKCPTSRDVWISTQGKAADYNMGAASTIKMKFIQEFAIVDFDVKVLKGKSVKEAWLYVKASGGWPKEYGLNGGTPFKHFSVATVGKEWVEGKSKRYATDAVGHGATFNESSYKKSNWGWPGARLVDVTLGNCRTYRGEVALEPHSGWLRGKLDTKLVRALVSGSTHGLLLMDGCGDIFMNPRISSREGGKGPYLLVTVGEPDTTAPGNVGGLKVMPATTWSTAKHGAVTVSLTVPENAFSYDVSVDGKPVDRWQIPFAEQTGQTQSFQILDLPADREVKVEVVAVDAAGNRSPTATATGRTAAALSVPALPDSDFKPKGGAPRNLGGAKIWAFPEVTKVHPVTGKVQFEKGAEQYSEKNPVWDGNSSTIRMAAAKGEIVSFQIALQGSVQGVDVTVSDLDGSGGIAAKGARVWRNWYVAGNSEYAIPFRDGQTVGCPMADNKVNGQTLQALTIDYHIPLEAGAGDHSGTVALKTGGEKVELKLKIKVYDVSIPETVFFNPELNCYSGPGKAGDVQFRESHRLAHYHRCAINRVPYSQTNRTHTDFVPAIGPDGHVTDWSAFDKNVGVLLDGSLFKDNPRAGVPVATLYMAHHEGWPLNYRDHYNAGCPTPSQKAMHANRNKNAKKYMMKHHIQAKPIAEALSKKYQQAFVNNVSDFYKHFQEKGWTRTGVQMYLNNKGWKGGYALWTLDEPYKWADWAALNHWGLLWKKGINDPEMYKPELYRQYWDKGGFAALKRKKPIFLYRGDISRFDWQGSLSDGIMTIVYGGAPPRVMRYSRDRMPAVLYTYGGPNAPTESNWQSAAWCLRAYTQYQDGVLPWQSLGPAKALWVGDKAKFGYCLIIDTDEQFGRAVASFRIHALRRGAQDCELLRLLQIKKGWSREHIQMLVSQRVPIRVKHRVSDAASAVKFRELSSRGFCELKEGILKLLTMN